MKRDETESLYFFFFIDFSLFNKCKKREPQFIVGKVGNIGKKKPKLLDDDDANGIRERTCVSD